MQSDDYDDEMGFLFVPADKEAHTTIIIPEPTRYSIRKKKLPSSSDVFMPQTTTTTSLSEMPPPVRFTRKPRLQQQAKQKDIKVIPPLPLVATTSKNFGAMNDDDDPIAALLWPQLRKKEGNHHHEEKKNNKKCTGKRKRAHEHDCI